MSMRQTWRRLSSALRQWIRALDRADIGRGLIALLMAGGLIVALLVLTEVRHLSRTADQESERLTATEAIEHAASTYDEISRQIKAVLLQMDDAEVSNQATATEFHRRQDQLLERTRGTEREVAALRAKVEALIAIEEARQETQLRFERWLEEAEASAGPAPPPEPPTEDS